MRRRDPDDDDDFYSRESETQSLLSKQQDAQLHHLEASVDRVSGMAHRVNEELRDQNRMIDDIDEEVDRTSGKLAGLQTQLRRISNEKDKGKYCVILCLVVLLFILVSMILND